MLSDELRALRYQAQQAVLGGGSRQFQTALPYRTDTNGDADGGFAPLGSFVRLENEAALAHFHRGLRQLASREAPNEKVRIVVYGGSHTEADAYPGYLRKYLQSRFGNGGQGFVLLGKLNSWYRTLDSQAWHQSLTVAHARYRLDVHDEPLGLFGAALYGRSSAGFGEVITARDSPNTEFEVQYYQQPHGGDFTLQVDDKSVARISTRSDRTAIGYHAFELPEGRHAIRARLRGNGRVRLFGITAETRGPGVVVDTLGIGGARMASVLRWDESIWAEALLHRQPALVVFAYGTNEASEEYHSATKYEQELRHSLQRLRRALPDASCLMVAPFDVEERRDGHWATLINLPGIIETQRRISKEYECAFWDGYAFMGGAGSMHRWAEARPQLASPDHVHLTKLGYVYAGIAIGDALMRRYDSAPGSIPTSPSGQSPADARATDGE